jgi:RimJ/RimL family protein N-acetyltransferase
MRTAASARLRLTAWRAAGTVLRVPTPTGPELTTAPASEETLRVLASWRYPPPYDFYDGDADPVLNPERFFGARDERGDLVGFYYFEPKPPDLEFGLGLRPDLTGQGLGLQFFLAGLALGRELYRPERVVLHVASFNERARRVYERAGFHVVSSHVRSFQRFGEVPFLTMAEAEPAPAPPLHTRLRSRGTSSC